MTSPNVSDSLEELLGIRPPSQPKIDLTNTNANPGSDLAQDDKQKEIPPIGVIKIRKSALEKIFILAQSVERIFGRPLEVYCICTGEKDVITDILIPKQNITYVSINIEPQHILALAPEIREKNLQVLGWAHSHANFGVFFSGTDDRNQLTLLTDTANYLEIEGVKVKFVYGMTVNTHKNLFGIVSTQYITGKITHVKAEFEIEDDLTDQWNSEEIENEIFEILRTKAQYHSYHDYNHSKDDQTDEVQAYINDQKIDEQ